MLLRNTLAAAERLLGGGAAELRGRSPRSN